MKSLPEIRASLIAGQFEFSRHAFKRAVERNIGDDEICETGQNAVIIEDYPDDKYAPSCLLFGFTNAHRPLHLQVSRAETDLVKIITLYEPDAAEWMNYTVRR